MLRTYRNTGNRLVPVDDTHPAVPGDVIWLDLLNPTPDEYQQVEQALGVSLPTREEMQEIEVSARLYSEAEAEFMTITALVHIDSDEPVHTPVTFVLKANTLATVRYLEPKAFLSFAARSQKAYGVACATGEQVMLSLIDALSDRMADALERVGVEIDGISRDVFRVRADAPPSIASRDLRSTLEHIGRNGDLLTKLRESLVSINRMLTYHSAEKVSREGRTRVRTLHRDVLALSDQSAFLSQKINFLLDATLGLINLEQNQIIKIFSIAAVIFLPPTLVASIYGMNFDHMPELKWMLGYPLALALMVLSAFVPYLWFKRRGWL